MLEEMVEELFLYYIYYIFLLLSIGSYEYNLITLSCFLHFLKSFSWMGWSQFVILFHYFDFIKHFSYQPLLTWLDWTKSTNYKPWNNSAPSSSYFLKITYRITVFYTEHFRDRSFQSYLYCKTKQFLKWI